MIFHFGNYQHADSSVGFRGVQKNVIFGQNGRPHTQRWNWQTEGKLIGTDSADIWTQLATLIDAYNVSNPSAAGWPGTPLYMRRGDTIGGIVVTSPVSHNGIYGAEGVTYLGYTCGIQADFKIASPGTVLAFSETLSFTDNAGLPTYVERTPIIGLPIKQMVATNSWYYATQSGSITTAFERSEPEPAIFPSLLRTGGNQGRMITYESPVFLRGSPVQFTTTWKYEYASVLPFSGYPRERT